MSRTKRGLRYAIRAACLSEFRSHRVGAALFKKNKLVGLGFNQKKTHPRCPTNHSQHAEFNTCIGMNREELADGLTIYIARLTRTGKVGLARPCESCDNMLVGLGIKKIFYTNHKGSLEQL